MYRKTTGGPHEICTEKKFSFANEIEKRTYHCFTVLKSASLEIVNSMSSSRADKKNMTKKSRCPIHSKNPDTVER